VSDGVKPPAGPSEPESGDDSVLSDLPGLGGFVALGTTIATCVAIGVLVGLWADSAWGLAPWGLLIGLVLGTALAVVSVLKLVRRWL
jgi:F0F1-type ATP synthase assembly protein I